MVARQAKSSRKVSANRSRKGAGEIGAKKKFRGQAQSDRQRQRQNDAERTDRDGPQGKKDRDFQRKF